MKIVATKLVYATAETLKNLRRHLVAAAASILTVAVSLSLVGAALLLGAGVDNATARWQGGVEFEVFLATEASDGQVSEVRQDLEDRPEVERVEYIAQEEQYELFQILFANRPEYLENVDPASLPASFRVEPTEADADVIEGIGAEISEHAAVREVVFAEETVRTLMDLSATAQTAILGVAAVLVLSAALLIFNTIRLTISARRRDVEVMRLVGASNWFIRVPFMLEGLIHGLVGGLVAYAAVRGFSSAGQRNLREVPMFEGFILLPSQVTGAGITLVVIGAILGTTGAGLAVTRYLGR